MEFSGDEAKQLLEELVKQQAKEAGTAKAGAGAKVGLLWHCPLFTHAYVSVEQTGFF